MEATCWVETIPLDDFDEDKSSLMTQLCATKWSSKVQFYRKVRSPRSVSDLMQYMYSINLVWLDDESFMLLKKLPKSVPRDSKFRKSISSISFARRTVYIYGKSEQSVAHATKLILCLKDEHTDQVRIANHQLRGDGPVVPTSFITSQFLCEYMQTNPQRRILLGRGCTLSKEESIALASHPTPLNVALAYRFADQGQAFIETLAQRTTQFGTLVLYGHPFSVFYSLFSAVGRLSELGNALSKVLLETSSCTFKAWQCLLPLALPARRVEYNIRSSMGYDEIETLTIVPKAVTLVFEYHLPPRFHTQFLQASGNLLELGVVYDIEFCRPSEAQGMELLQAIAANQNLHQLELGCLNGLRPIWEQLLEVIRTHKSLRAVVFWVRRHRPNLEQVKTLVPVLKERIHLDISFKSRGPWSDLVHSMEAIIEPVRSQKRARALTLESVHDRPAVFGSALTNWACGQFHKTCSLLSENDDLLCSLMEDPSSLTPQRRRTRQTEILVLPESKKRKSS